MEEKMTNEEQPNVTISSIAQPVHFTIKKGSKGQFQYEVSIHAATVEEAKKLAAESVEYLEGKYGGQGDEEKPE